MTNADRVRIDTGRATFSVGFAVPLYPDRIFGEFGLLAGVGLGRVRDAVALQSNGQVFNSYASMSVHWGISLRLRAVLTQFLTIGVEYRYSEEVGKNLGKSSDRSIVSYRADSNQFIGWIGYRFGQS